VLSFSRKTEKSLNFQCTPFRKNDVTEPKATLITSEGQFQQPREGQFQQPREGQFQQPREGQFQQPLASLMRLFLKNSMEFNNII